MEARRQKFVYLGDHPAKAGQGTVLSCFPPPSTPHPDPYVGLPGTHSVLGVKSLPDIQVLPDLLSHPGFSFCYLNWHDLLLYPRVQLWSLLFIYWAVLGVCCCSGFSLAAVSGLLTATASLVAGSRAFRLQWLRKVGSVVAAPRL